MALDKLAQGMLQTFHWARQTDLATAAVAAGYSSSIGRSGMWSMVGQDVEETHDAARGRQRAAGSPFKATRTMSTSQVQIPQGPLDLEQLPLPLLGGIDGDPSVAASVSGATTARDWTYDITNSDAEVENYTALLVTRNQDSTPDVQRIQAPKLFCTQFTLSANPGDGGLVQCAETWMGGELAAGPNPTTPPVPKAPIFVPSKTGVSFGIYDTFAQAAAGAAQAAADDLIEFTLTVPTGWRMVGRSSGVIDYDTITRMTVHPTLTMTALMSNESTNIAVVERAKKVARDIRFVRINLTTTDVIETVSSTAYHHGLTIIMSMQHAADSMTTYGAVGAGGDTEIVGMSFRVVDPSTSGSDPQVRFIHRYSGATYAGASY